MSLKIKGFARLFNFTVNEIGKDCPFGEVNDYMMTFSPTVGQYSSGQYPNVELLTFSTLDDNKQETVVNEESKEYILKVINTISQGVLAKTINNNIQSVKTILLTQLGVEFQLQSIGKMINYGDYYCPTYLEFKYLGRELTNVLLWFGQDAFIKQYEEFEHIVVSGVSDLNKLYNQPDEVKELLNKITPLVMNELERDAIKTRPETSTVSHRYMVYSLQKEPIGYVYFSIVIYGQYGINEDLERETLIDFILKHSSHSREEWEIVLPDLFVRTEFRLFPTWDKVGLPNNGLVGAMYRSSIKINDAKKMLSKYCKDFSDSHLNKYGCVNAARYKSVMLISVGHPDNRHKIYSLDEQWPHYGNIRTTSEDYGRYDEATKTFLDALLVMFKLAEDIDGLVTMPRGFTKIKRGDDIYISHTMNNIQYIMLTKKSLLGEK
jgi:hypothetical protein